MRKSKVKYGILFLALILGILLYNLYPGEKIPANAIVDRIVVSKSGRKLIVYSKGEKLVTYKIALGRNPIGAKKYESDCKTPEGIYFINSKTSESKFHKNLGISYPNENDLNNAGFAGKSAGANIKIHGLQNGLGFIGRLQTLLDWTAGCIALTNEQVDDLYNHTPVGTLVEIDP